MPLHWMRVLDTVGGLAELAGRMAGGRSAAAPSVSSVPAAGPLGQLETKLTGVLVAALKEAFDRDSARLELERSQQEAEQARLDAEQRRLDAALQAELRRQEAESRRQAVDRALAQFRGVGLMAIGVWALSAVLAALVPGMRADLPRVLLAVGWALAIAALGGAFAGHRRLSIWSDEAGAGAAALPRHAVADAAPWLLLAALAAIAGSILTAL